MYPRTKADLMGCLLKQRSERPFAHARLSKTLTTPYVHPINRGVTSSKILQVQKLGHLNFLRISTCRKSCLTFGAVHPALVLEAAVTENGGRSATHIPSLQSNRSLYTYSGATEPKLVRTRVCFVHGQSG